MQLYPVREMVSVQLTVNGHSVVRWKAICYHLNASWSGSVLVLWTLKYVFLISWALLLIDLTLCKHGALQQDCGQFYSPVRPTRLTILGKRAKVYHLEFSIPEFAKVVMITLLLLASEEERQTESRRQEQVQRCWTKAYGELSASQYSVTN